MLKDGIVVAAIALTLSAPGFAQATPLSWTPGPDVLVKLSNWWGSLLPAAPVARSARDARKNGAGWDPNDLAGTDQQALPKLPPAPHGGN
jgi:hypothetical protein